MSADPIGAPESMSGWGVMAFALTFTQVILGVAAAGLFVFFRPADGWTDAATVVGLSTGWLTTVAASNGVYAWAMWSTAHAKVVAAQAEGVTKLAAFQAEVDAAREREQAENANAQQQNEDRVAALTAIWNALSDADRKRVSTLGPIKSWRRE